MRATRRSELRAGWMIAAMIVSACAAYGQRTSAESTAREDKATYEAVCGACHPTALTDGFRSTSEWKETIDQMIEQGAEMTPKQLQQVRRHLLRTWTKVNVNSATASELAAVLEISEGAADGLVKYRTEKGSFKTLEELKRMPGIDASKLDARKERIVF